MGTKYFFSSRHYLIVVPVFLFGVGLFLLSNNKLISTASAQQMAITAPQASVVTPAMLTAAGFTGVSVQPPQRDRFLPPNYYFHVAETVPTSLGWGDASNIVAVLVRPKDDPRWQYNNGTMQVLDIVGRTQARLTSAHNYIVVTGPDRQKVIDLANNLATTF